MVQVWNSRTWDNLSLDIRNKKISRKEAIEFLRDTGNENQKKKSMNFVNTPIFNKVIYEIREV